MLEQLNTFGGAQQSILGAQDGNGDVSKLLVVVEGVDKGMLLVPQSWVWGGGM